MQKTYEHKSKMKSISVDAEKPRLEKMDVGVLVCADVGVGFYLVLLLLVRFVGF